MSSQGLPTWHVLLGIVDEANNLLLRASSRYFLVDQITREKLCLPTGPGQEEVRGEFMGSRAAGLRP